MTRKRKVNPNPTTQPATAPFVALEKPFTVGPDGVCVIDGSTMEGGGQILRNSVSLAALLGKPIRIENIRAKRPKPGLKAQHLQGISLVREMYDAQLTGGKVDSMSIEFKSSKEFKYKKKFIADTRTAGSVCLLLQTSLPCMIFAPASLTLDLLGGTNAANAPQIDYATMIFNPIAEKFGIHLDIDIVKRGFYPRGGGEVVIKTNPVSTLQPITMLERGNVTKVKSFTFVSGKIPGHVANRMSETAKKVISKHFRSVEQNPEMDFEIKAVDAQMAVGDGCGIILAAHTDTGCILGGTGLGELRKSAETVAEEAAEELLSNLATGGCVDEYLQDQIIIFMALAKGKSSVLVGPLSMHTKTSLHFTECLTGCKFTISEQGTKNLIECDGIGFQNPKYNPQQQQENGKESKQESKE